MDCSSVEELLTRVARVPNTWPWTWLIDLRPESWHASFCQVWVSANLLFYNNGLYIKVGQTDKNGQIGYYSDSNMCTLCTLIFYMQGIYSNNIKSVSEKN